MKTYKRMGGNENPTTPVWILDQRIDLAVLLICVLTVSCCCSVTKLCLTLCDSVDSSTPGSSVLHYLLELAQSHVHWVCDAIHPSHPLSPPSPPALNLSQHQDLSNDRLFISSGQSIGASASGSVLPMNIQGWFPLGLTGLISLLSKGLLRVFSSTAV